MNYLSAQTKWEGLTGQEWDPEDEPTPEFDEPTPDFEDEPPPEFESADHHVAFIRDR